MLIYSLIEMGRDPSVERTSGTAAHHVDVGISVQESGRLLRPGYERFSYGWHIATRKDNARSLRPTARAEENARSVDGLRDDDLFARVGRIQKKFSTPQAHTSLNGHCLAA
jgi:hypothetical protein